MNDHDNGNDPDPEIKRNGIPGENIQQDPTRQKLGHNIGDVVHQAGDNGVHSDNIALVIFSQQITRCGEAIFLSQYPDAGPEIPEESCGDDDARQRGHHKGCANGVDGAGNSRHPNSTENRGIHGKGHHHPSQIPGGHHVIAHVLGQFSLGRPGDQNKDDKVGHQSRDNQGVVGED